MGSTNIVKNNDKEEYVYSGYGIAYGKSEWIFSNDFARNVIIFGVDKSSSSHADNLENDFLILGKGDTLVHPKKKIVINCSKAKTKFSLSLHSNSIIVIYL